MAPGGVLLFSIREGTGEQVEEGSDGGKYYVASWREEELHAILRPLGFTLLRVMAGADSEGRWLFMLLQRDLRR